MEQKETIKGKAYILCAALWYDSGLKFEHQPKNIETGVVFCGRRHHNCFIPLDAAFPERDKSTVKQGFITSDDRFVNRKEAAEIALKAGQITDQTNECLFSEDLY